MTATQTQIRRDSSTNLNAATPASGELGWDTTNKRLRGGDGSTAGGIYIPNRFDIQGQSFLAVDSGGAANVQTMTLGTGLIPTAYAKYQRFVFKAGFTNTSSMTMNINALGAKAVKKMSTAGVVALTGGEVYAGQIYAIVYDGTDFMLESFPSASVSSGMTLLGVNTPSSSATSDVTSLITTAYDYYEIVFDLIPATDAVDLWIRTSTDNGSTFTSSAAAYQHSNLGPAVGFNADWVRNSSAGDTKIILNGNNSIGNAAAEGITGIIRLNKFSVARKCVLAWDAQFWDTSGDGTGNLGYAERSASADIDAVRFLFSSGNIASGKIRTYARAMS